MVENINSDYWETGATISADGKIFYFVSDRPEGYGGGESDDDGIYKTAPSGLNPCLYKTPSDG